jgi:long-chain fatty acid transport protein
MMGIVKIAVGALLGLALLSPGVAASGFENSAVGTTAQGMGGAFRAIADDWTASYYNPAGLAFQKDNQFGGYATFTQLRDELNPKFRYVSIVGADTLYYETGVLNDRQIYNFHKIFYTPGSGVVTRLPVGKQEMVFGFSMYQPFDYNITWGLYQPPTAYNDSSTGRYPSEQFKNDIDVVAFQLTAAKAFSGDKLALGVGLQLLRADLIYNDVLFRDNPMSDTLAVRPWEHVPEFTSVDGNGWGFGIRAGLMYKYNRGTLALTAAMPFDITIKGKAKLNYLMPKNTTGARSYVVGSPEYLFTTGSAVGLNSDFETKLNLPMSAAIAGSYRATEKLTLALDAEVMMWSNFDGLTFTYSNFSELPIGGSSEDIAAFFKANTVRPANWKAAGKVALGARYELSPKLTLLAGGSLDQSADRNNESIGPQLVDTGDKLGLNVGGILHPTPRFNCALVFSYAHYPSISTNTLNDLNGDGIVDSFAGDYKAKTIETALSFDYRF